MNEEDIKKQLEVKNKEIYKNKLDLDLTNNLEVLVLALDNLLNNIKHDTTLKVLGIAETFQKESIIKDNITKFIDNYREYLMKLLDNKKNNIEKIILKEDKIDEYKQTLLNDNKELTKEIQNYSQDKIIILVKSLKELFDDKLYQNRIEDYLKNIFLSNLNDKVIDIIECRDIILINTFKESFLKYLELNKNTVG